MKILLTDPERKLIKKLSLRYAANKDIFDALGEALFRTVTTSPGLIPLIHSAKYRVKELSHFEEKIERKIREKGLTKTAFTEANIFQRVTDLVGVRLLHLHTTQIEQIDRELRACLKANRYELIQGPTAKTWDLEYKQYFKSLGMKTEDSPSQYTSVHYIFSAKNDLKLTFEIQVRTLAEELWGEVNHRINYPLAHEEISCTEQIAVLARVTSSCTRLVDAIVRSDEAFHIRKKKPKRR